MHKEIFKRLVAPIQKAIERKERKRFEEKLKTIQEISDHSASERVLIDAGWDNPNYWLRYSILHAALNWSPKHLMGYLGPFRRKEQLGTLSYFGIERWGDLMKERPSFQANIKLAEHYCATFKRQSDIIEAKLPSELPGVLLYDYILKKQRAAYVDLGDVSVKHHVLFFLNAITSANEVLAAEKPDLVVSSHAISWFSALLWVALQKKIPVIVPFGDNGVLRFWRIDHPGHLYDFADRLKFHEALSLSKEKREALAVVGESVLRKRFSGSSNNLGALFAYGNRRKSVDRAAICDQYRWDHQKKIVGVYASNWFDFPHGAGMKHFENFYDWISQTLEKMAVNKTVNWLLKAHPCDEWYGGLTLEDMVNVDRYDHIRLASKHWNGLDMIKSLDAFITYHGTIGIEAAALKKPVMVADQGWYEDWGFVKRPASREDYLELLGTQWWSEMDGEKNATLARIFSGVYWGIPLWQKEWLLGDDSEQWRIYQTAPNLIDNNRHVITQEIEMVRKWYASRRPHYHAYKMIHSDSYLCS